MAEKYTGCICVWEELLLDCFLAALFMIFIINGITEPPKAPIFPMDLNQTSSGFYP